MNGRLKEFEKFLNKYQSDLDKELSKKSDNQSSNNRLTYKKNVLRVVDEFINDLYKNKLMNELYKYKLEKSCTTTEYNIVVESIAKILSNNNIHNLNMETRLFVYNKYPILIYNLLLNSNVDEIITLVKTLIDECKINKYVHTEIELTQLLNYCENFDIILKNNSALCIFNNFYGINFKKVGVKHTEIPLKNNILIINMGYNFNTPQDNIVYTSSKQYSKFFLDEDILDQFKFMTKIQIQPKKDLFSLNKFNNDNFTIAINYNNSVNDSECFYSLTDPIFTEYQINNLLKGGILSGIPKISYEIYVSTLFYQYIDKIDKKNETMGEEMSKIYPLIKQFYNTNPIQTIKNWNLWCERQFKDELEQKMFKIYIDKLKQLMDEENKLDYFKYISHISNYFVIEIS